MYDPTFFFQQSEEPRQGSVCWTRVLRAASTRPPGAALNMIRKSWQRHAYLAGVAALCGVLLLAAGWQEQRRLPTGGVNEPFELCGGGGCGEGTTQINMVSGCEQCWSISCSIASSFLDGCLLRNKPSRSLPLTLPVPLYDAFLSCMCCTFHDMPLFWLQMGFQSGAGISSAPPAPPPPAPSQQGPSKMSDRTYRRFLRDERVIEDLRDKFDAFKASAFLREMSKSR